MEYSYEAQEAPKPKAECPEQLRPMLLQLLGLPMCYQAHQPQRCPHRYSHAGKPLNLAAAAASKHPSWPSHAEPSIRYRNAPHCTQRPVEHSSTARQKKFPSDPRERRR